MLAIPIGSCVLRLDYLIPPIIIIILLYKLDKYLDKKVKEKEKWEKEKLKQKQKKKKLKK